MLLTSSAVNDVGFYAHKPIILVSVALNPLNDFHSTASNHIIKFLFLLRNWRLTLTIVPFVALVLINVIESLMLYFNVLDEVQIRLRVF
jgi:hypothetical protein